MSLSVFLAVLLAAALHAGWNVLVKGASDKPLASASVCAGCGVIGLAFLPFVPVPDAASWPWALCSSRMCSWADRLTFLDWSGSIFDGSGRRKG